LCYSCVHSLHGHELLDSFSWKVISVKHNAFWRSLSANYLFLSPQKKVLLPPCGRIYSFPELRFLNLGTVALKDIHYSTYLCDSNVRDILVILVLSPCPTCALALVFSGYAHVTYCALQKVLTHVLEEAGYTKDSHFTLPDFMKVSLFLL